LVVPFLCFLGTLGKGLALVQQGYGVLQQLCPAGSYPVIFSFALPSEVRKGQAESFAALLFLSP